jgi:primosomal protein N' (replication factor Y)
LLQSILQSDWKSFYKAEIEERKRYFFHPFCHILKLTCHRASTGSAEKAAKSLKDLLISKKIRVQIEGPAPAFHEQLAGKYYWQLVVKSYKRSDLIRVIDQLPGSGWSYDLDPTDLL